MCLFKRRSRHHANSPMAPMMKMPTDTPTPTPILVALFELLAAVIGVEIGVELGSDVCGLILDAVEAMDDVDEDVSV